MDEEPTADGPPWLPTVLGLRGALAIGFGLLAIALPDMTFSVLVLVFGAFVLVDGLFNLAGGVSKRRWTLLVEGLFGVGLGLAVLALPDLSRLVLVYAIAAWAGLTGAAELVDLARRPRQQHAWWIGFGGVISILFAVVLALNPGRGIRIVVLVVGFYALIFGASLLFAAYRLRRRARRGPTPG